MSECQINFLVGNVDIEFAAFVEARAVCARAFAALNEHCKRSRVHAMAGRLSETLRNSQLPLWSVIREVDGTYFY